jgi:hypothetical protein
MNRSYRSPGTGRVVWRRLAAITGLLIGALGTAIAGEPLLYTPSGKPAGWSSARPPRYAVDPSTLGNRTHAAAVAMANKAFGVWTAVSTAQVPVQSAGELSQHFKGSTVVSFLNGLRTTDPCPIFFDNDGSITETLFGTGSSQSVLGFGGPMRIDPRTNQILLALVVLNGPLLAPYSDAYLTDAMVHEFGHLLGLDHSQLNGDRLYDGDPTNDVLAPVMSYFRGPNAVATLAYDDEAWISTLYPTPGFITSTGTIRGRVLLPDGKTGFRGALVIARQIGRPDTICVSGFSGDIFLAAGSGDPDPARLGEFMIPGLPPGSYTIEILQLDAGTAHRVPAAYLPGGPKLWREGSSAQDQPTVSTPILVNAGQEVKGIDIVLNGEDLGAPRAIAETEPNELPNGQRVTTLPATITGQVENGPGDTADPPVADTALMAQMQDVYRVAVGEYTTVTAILTAAQSAADLDLYVIGKDSTGAHTVAGTFQEGTPPETLQLRLPPGVWYFGVHRAGVLGTAYTLQLLASPSPEPDAPPDIAYLGYMLLGDVTPTSATARWSTTSPSTSVVYYNQPYQEIGSTKRVLEHSLALTGLAPGSRTRVEVISQPGDRPDEVDGTTVTLSTASPPDPAGAPRMVVTSTPTLLGTGFAEVVVRLNNAGDGDALKVHIDQITLAAGWVPLSYYVAAIALPNTLDLGGIGAGGAGLFVVRILQTSGGSAAKVTVKGSYTDASGTPMKF